MHTKITALLLFVMVFIGCNHNNSRKAEGDDLHPFTYTLYTNKTEMFVEFAPLIVGETTDFAAHFTILGEYFRPLAQGKITVTLEMNGKTISNTSDTPHKPGIFELDLKPVQKGAGTLVFDIQAKDYTDRIIIPNVMVYPSITEAKKDAKEETASGEITYLKDQAWKIEFANQPVVKQPFYEVIKTSGQILSAPGDEMVIAAKADGIVTFAGNKTIVGSAVNEGTPLFLISGNNLAKSNIDASVREAKMNYLKFKADYERAEELAKDMIISQKEFQTIKLLYDNARNEYNTISKNYSSGGQNIAAPMSGFIKSVNVTDGQFVTAGTPLATISKNKRLLLQANVSQKYFGKLPSVTTANFSVASGKTYDTKALNGKLVSFGKSASAGSPFIPVTFEIDNIGEIIPGSAVQVFLKSSPMPNALVIPLTAVMEQQGVFYVYIQTGGESFQKREVSLGANDGKDVQVLSGVLEGERVVTKGAYQIKLASASGTMPAHSHEH